MIHVTECPVCNSTAFKSLFICKDYSISREDFTLIQCEYCNFVITSPRPTSGELGRYYASDNYISHSDTAQGLINKLYHFIRKITLRGKISLIKKYSNNPRLLDIGSGAGYFLNSCKQSGFAAIGIEPDTPSRMRSIQQFGIDVHEESELDKLNSSGFDIITLWHVLEHVENLNNRMSQICRLLDSEGIVIIALPNCSSFDARHYQSFWAGYDVPRHLWHFTPQTIRDLGFKHGLTVFKTLPMHFDSYYVSMLSEKYKKSTLAFIKGMFIGLISNLRATLKQNNSYSSQIYLLRKTSK